MIIIREMETGIQETVLVDKVVDEMKKRLKRQYLMRMIDDVFCKIVKGEIKAQAAYKDDEFWVLKDINPQAPIHLLIVPPSISLPEDFMEGDNDGYWVEHLKSLMGLPIRLAFEKGLSFDN